jgi:hypothetical protein
LPFQFTCHAGRRGNYEEKNYGTIGAHVVARRILSAYRDIAVMDETVKALVPRFVIILVIFIALAVSYVLFGAPALIPLFVCLFLFMLAIFIFDFATNGAFSMWQFSKIKELGWYKVEPELKLVAGEEIVHPLSPAYLRMSAAGYSFMPRDIIITNKRVAIGFNVLGAKEVFGEMNLWRPSMAKIPSVEKKYTGILAFLGDGRVKEAKVGRNGKAALITVTQAGINILVEIFHPRAQEICKLLSE